MQLWRLTESLDPSPPGREIYEFLPDAADDFPGACVNQAECDVIVLVCRSGPVGLGDVLVHRTRVHAPSGKILLLRGRNEVIDSGAAALDLEAAFPSFRQLSSHPSAIKPIDP